VIHRLAQALVKRSVRARSYLEAVGAAVIAYLSALVGVQIAELVAADRWLVVTVHAAVVVVLLAAVSLLAAHLGGALSDLTERRQNLLRHADDEAELVVISMHEYLAQVRAESLTPALWVPHDAERAIRAEVFGLYRTLVGAQGPSAPGMRVDFEVNFMTRSPEDERLTIAFWANRQNRAPISLTMRRKNPDIYEQSVTADMYRESKERRPLPRLIESTIRAGDDYRALYPDQKERVRSTIVFPVLDLQTRLVGALVVHCDKEDYFRASDYTFWCELLDPIATRIALEYERLQATQTRPHNAAQSPSLSVIRPSPAPRHR
jgi:hypothetical protein